MTAFLTGLGLALISRLGFDVAMVRLERRDPEMAILLVSGGSALFGAGMIVGAVAG